MTLPEREEVSIVVVPVGQLRRLIADEVGRAIQDLLQRRRATAQILTPKEAASIVRVRHSLIYESLRNGELPGRRLGKGWRIELADLERWADRELR